MPAWIIALLSAVVGGVVGAFANGAVEFCFWRRRHREEVQSLEESEMRKVRARAAERLREIGVLFIELARLPVQGQYIEQTQSNTARFIEILRLQRELVNATITAREAFPEQDHLLTIFRRRLTQKVPLDLSQDSGKSLQDELDAVLAKLKNP